MERLGNHGPQRERYRKELAEIQNLRCAICPHHFLTSLSDSDVDHNHSTGIVRGLLCRSCNRALAGLEACGGSYYFAQRGLLDIARAYLESYT